MDKKWLHNKIVPEETLKIQVTGPEKILITST